MKAEMQHSAPAAEIPDRNELKWDYECQTCATCFSIKVPKGPREERAIRCSACGSRDIRRINVCQLSEAAACG